MGEQAGVLRFELLAVLQGQMERGSGVGREEEERQAVRDGRPKPGPKEPARGARVRGWGETGPATNSRHRNTAAGQEGAVVSMGNGNGTRRGK